MNMKEFHQEKTAGEAIQSNRHAPVVSNNQPNGRNGEEVTPENMLLQSLIKGMNEFYSRNLARELTNAFKDTRKRKHTQFLHHIPESIETSGEMSDEDIIEDDNIEE